jgi:glucose/arabinose dehydrogenase
MIEFVLRARIGATALAMTLAACGGGGGGGGDPSGDTQPPVATLTAPANLATDLTGVLTLSASATDNVGVATIEFQIDGQAVGVAGSGPVHSVALDSTAYASGQHVVRARAADAAGNLSAWASATVNFGGSRTQPTGFANEGVIAGLSSATAFAQTPDGRFLVAQQGGALRVVANGALLTQPMLTLANVDADGERGLLGVAVHPSFASNGWIYVYHTTTEGGTHNRISRFTVSGNLASSGVTVVDLPALSGATNHNGGALHFGQDGKLYVGVGDNNNGAHSPDLGSMFGKLMRFNDDGTIPNDNPFCTTPSQLSCAVWARGLRNPFTFTVNGADGRIHINDVGAASWEEINLGAAGANYGWPATEGPTTATGVTSPLFAYGHTATVPPGSGAGGFVTGCSVIGGAFYPSGGNFPAQYRGSYFFTDLCSRRVYRLDAANGNAVYAFGAVDSTPVGMLVGLDGALYVLARGEISRFRAL